MIDNTKTKRILITGANSYIGTCFENYLKQWPDEYIVDTVDMIDGSWRDKSFSNYDTVYHVAGIAHIKETKDNAHLYFDVNKEMAFETAQKAKGDGVRQYIFMSSMSVYGIEKGVISANTSTQPVSNYGKSKLQAEKLLKKLNDEFFHVAILRPPMVYGKGCKGNYTTLVKYAKKLTFFPDYQNKRSMIYIGNLTAFVKHLADEGSAGLFCPQNTEYVCTSEMVRLVAEANGKKIRLTKVFNPLIRISKNNLIQKVFGDLYYDDGKNAVDEFDFETSIKISEGVK